MSTFFTRSVRTALFAAAAVAVSISSAQAQTTLILDAPGTQVTDVMIQAGASANTNFNSTDMLATLASTNYDDLRRALLKFDTQNTIPAKSTIQSAVMTLTLKDAGTDAARSISVFPVTISFLPEAATWNLGTLAPGERKNVKLTVLANRQSDPVKITATAISTNTTMFPICASSGEASRSPLSCRKNTT